MEIFINTDQTPEAPVPVEPAENTVIKNDGFWPDIDLNQYREESRQDGTITQPRVIEAALFAINEVNDRLTVWRLTQQKQGYRSAAEVPAEKLNEESTRIQLYRTAVFCLMQARLTDRFRGFDTTGAGGKRADSLEPTIDNLRRDAAWAINDIQAINRMTVELI
ncbi:head completion/stabilization protein [Yersinia enterocolitica]|uniref:head completion/stabilization protein n=1 Tax=Yersinia enterocolitica TaxID=630 RepID=UPI0005E1858D|nr:head completion/stabilization protein [Yersinia enterocolitica]UXD29875.1 Phage head completion-stabilization protein [Yersinia enterocolitica]UYJ79149.1 head completion/stabilization protein [Yersinia enterocolitica]CFQ95843.1 orf4 of phage P2 (gene L) [Yersinia enterocolitica]HDL8332275.1 head completion/stabilization protein [Yersinia enterocolitica]HDL8401537.1 head completion/stabilization protein [Yersinia enterocolitica]